jgi:hypothetical protein
MVAVGDKPESQGKPGQQQRPDVQVGDRAPARKTDPGHSVMEVLAVPPVDRLAILQPLEHHERRVEEGHCQQHER